MLLGKNGCGKSTALKAIYGAADSIATGWQPTRYITPERGGVLLFESGVEQNIINNASWLGSSRAANQFNQFKQQTVVQYRRLELGVLRKVEAAAKAREESSLYFSDYLVRINSLLDNIEIRPGGLDSGFKMYNKASNDEIPPKNISSGESELIALAIEALVFVQEISAGKRGLLLLDEPDVHLHPDLQARLVRFLVQLLEEFDFYIMMATHSTPILGELSAYAGATVCPMTAHQTILRFEPIDEIYKQLLPVFGAHPLTRVFSNAPILLVEGEDDVRIWQQAIRTSGGKICLYPVACEGLPFMPSYEDRLVMVMDSVYDGATAYSLRDRDDNPVQIEDKLPVKRMRLACRAAENLLLSDDVLTSLGLSWDDVSSRIDDWLKDNEGHAKHPFMTTFARGGKDRKMADLKEIRMILVGQILASNKPWEVLVGQVIGKLGNTSARSGSPDSVCEYLGSKVVENLLPAA